MPRSYGHGTSLQSIPREHLIERQLNVATEGPHQCEQDMPEMASEPVNMHEEEHTDSTIRGMKGTHSNDIIKLSALLEAGVTLKAAERILYAFDPNNDELKRLVCLHMGSSNRRNLNVSYVCGETQEGTRCNRCESGCVEYITADVVQQLEEIVNRERKTLEKVSQDVAEGRSTSSMAMDFEPDYESPTFARLENTHFGHPATESCQIDVETFYHMYLMDGNGIPITPSDKELLEIVPPDGFVDSTYLEKCPQTFENLKIFSRVSHEIFRARNIYAETKKIGQAKTQTAIGKVRRGFYPPFPPLHGKTFNMMRSQSSKAIVMCPISGVSKNLSSAPGGSLKSFDIDPSQSLPDVCSSFCKYISIQLWSSNDFVRLTGSGRSLRNKYITLSDTFIFEVRALFIVAWQLRDLTDTQLMELTDRIRCGFSEFFDNCRNKIGKQRRLSTYNNDALNMSDSAQK